MSHRSRRHSVCEHPLAAQGAGPYGITADADGALYFTLNQADVIGRLTTDGRIREFPLPQRDSRPHAIAADPEGGFWFSEWGATRVGHISAEGEIDLFDLPTPSSEPHGITVTANGTVWVALESLRHRCQSGSRRNPP